MNYMNSKITPAIQARYAAVVARIDGVPALKTSTDCCSFSLAQQQRWRARDWMHSIDVHADQRADGALLLAEGYLDRLGC